MTKNYATMLAVAMISFLAFGCSTAPSAPPPNVTVAVSSPTPALAPELSPTIPLLPAITPVPADTSTPTPAGTSTPAQAPSVVPTLAPTQTAAPTQAAAPPCDNSAFVADMTVPDGTVLATGQPFNKIWRVRNTGTCTWDSNYTFRFISGSAMGGQTITVPPTAPGATADLLVAMTAPSTPGAFTGFWRMRNPAGANFGVTVWVKINAVNLAPAPAPAPSLTPTVQPTSASACSGTPNIASFAISPSTITAGSSSTLSWGFVSNADAAIIDNGIGGVATPGSTSVSPATTTTYTITANCGSTTTTAAVTLTVVPAATDTPTVTSATETPTTVPATATATATRTATPTRTATRTRTP